MGGSVVGRGKETSCALPVLVVKSVCSSNSSSGRLASRLGFATPKMEREREGDLSVACNRAEEKMTEINRPMRKLQICPLKLFFFIRNSFLVLLRKKNNTIPF